MVGVADDATGMVPLACCILADGAHLDETLEARLKRLVHIEHGEAWVPAHLVQVAALPRTRNGKAMRQVVQKLFAGGYLGDVAEMKNPECLLELMSSVDEWRELQSMADM